jgi:hypothetical protein
VKPAIYLHIVLNLKMYGAAPPVPRKPSWHCAWLKRYKFYLTLTGIFWSAALENAGARFLFYFSLVVRVRD